MKDSGGRSAFGKRIFISPIHYETKKLKSSGKAFWSKGAKINELEGVTTMEADIGYLRLVVTSGAYEFEVLYE